MTNLMLRVVVVVMVPYNGDVRYDDGTSVKAEYGDSGSTIKDNRYDVGDNDVMLNLPIYYTMLWMHKH